MKKDKIITISFIAFEVIIFILLTCFAKYISTRWFSYSAIVICFLYALYYINRSNDHLILVVALFLTLLSDTCLIAIGNWRTLGMIFFNFVQIAYALRFYQTYKHEIKRKSYLSVYIFANVMAQIIAYTVIKDSYDLLVFLSVSYGVNIIINCIFAWVKRRTNLLMPIAFSLFILCDIMVMLGNAEGYLVISETGLIAKLLALPFDLAWLFYLPSQVIMCLTTSDLKAKLS